ncbi:MAG: anthranilate phosphoribosyltransferase [Sphingobacteriales bacterium]|jgi:anthranilate phosphoribosyltransferase|nr:MAG: anthranilate phosphoribosyltransferase [Sphingobacteriales bacterium]
MKNTLQRLYTGHFLSEEEAFQLMLDITNRKFNDIQISAVLSALNMRLPNSSEMLGFKNALLEQAVHINLNQKNILDIVGTGGDGKNTFNISTLACLVCAGAGVKVAKHGNYGVSSVSGSSNILEAVGVVFSNDESVLQQQINDANITFLHAPLFHPAMKNVAEVRKNMGVKTIFNLLGPLSNPSKPTTQLIGVHSEWIGKLYKDVLRQTKTNFAIVHSIDGYDEISLTSETKIFTKKQDIFYTPHAFGMDIITPESIFGGDTIESNQNIFMNILNGKGSTAQNNVVIANAALAISLYFEKELDDSVALAKDSLLGLKALSSLRKLTKS